ncbi:hypothetical protein [Achromobacter denitrificans]|uniref:TFIIB-type zinc ribbon-containing protein n=1 Tax=Achromobacter denitrificans TaxID=32002 RepID=A0A6N0JVP0_ACHDE|nr:hypothetical protein [Achromobacter denitrificans]MDF3851375.1 hypothetical protein [Achromobacter denitrificans]QKQ51047.1 hypothetical protein FOC81_31725 [Achromobacter denitrificans]
MFKFDLSFKENPDFAVPVPCPKCGHKQTETIGRLRQDPNITCGGCGITIAVNTEQIEAFLAALKGMGG